ncbi:MAG: hypothetical protein B6I30_08280 [Desulfobacteraceae bacterium 4572_187]|nr:MAG: hypothetical protein B6I30_08280 [Desulfobacteraceae bacterium 4572_187]
MIYLLLRSFGFNTPPLGALQKKSPFDTPSACGGVVHFLQALVIACPKTVPKSLSEMCLNK